jgi:ATP-binding cassette subfamily B protein
MKLNLKKKQKKNGKKKIDYKYNFREYLSLVSKNRTLFIGMILSVIFLETLNIADKFLYKALVDNAEKFISGNILQNVFVQIVLIIAGVYFGLIILKATMRFVNDKLLLNLEPRMGFELKKKYLNHIVSLHNEFHTSHKSGKLISRLGRGENGVMRLTEIFIFQIGPLILQIIMVGVSIAIFSVQSALVLLLVSILFVSFSLYLNKIQARRKQEKNSSQDRERGFVADVLTNVQTVKYYGREKRIAKLFDGFLNKTKVAEKKYYSYFAPMSFGQTLIVGLGLLALIYFPMKEFIAGEMTLGTIIFIYSLYGNIASNLYSFVWGIRNFYHAMADIQGLFQYGKLENEIKDSPGARDLKIKEGSVEFRNVSFTYPEKKGKGKEIFKKFNLKIKPNEKIALVGHSGSGKTTVVKLLNRFYDVNGGEILIDGTKIKEVRQESLRGETGIVPQEAILFDDTIYNNIKFAKPTANRAQVLEAIKLAQLDKIIKTFPKGIKTIVGERGVKLSGGEKQRVSIARAILSDKKILVLDEATSALDSATEHEIQKALDKLLEGRTSIIIAHRLSTIMKSDRIIVMNEGKIVEEGSHRALLKKKGEYYKLWNMQSGGYLPEEN